ncbi:MAG TPA: ABC transporter ATP-binding protein [Candidatus Dormibacteraeota bacterium]|nr:ABC transporter ATP-binding protein [Candidatus Dormibacteraeota bacterium]
MIAPQAESATPILEVRNLSKRFGGLWALRDVSFSVAEGQILGVIGPNGAGKSTLVNLITGFSRPTSGQVLIDGLDVTGARPWAIAHDHVARTFQIVKPFRGLTVRENVAIGAMHGNERDLSVSDSLATADELLVLVGIAQHANDAPNQLSVADARRLELAKALATRPRLLLIDEVMAGLRYAEIEAAVQLIHRLRDSGITIVAIEHVMKAIVSVSDRILVLHHGSIIASGAPQDVLADQRVIEAYLGNRYAKRRST